MVRPIESKTCILMTVAISGLHLRWSDLKVSSLELSAPLSIRPTLKVEDTIKIMNKEGYDQLPVIDDKG